MTPTRNRGWGVRYLEKLIADREAAGLPPAPDVADEAYWRQREKDWADQQGLNIAEATMDEAA
jgi:hypothetical protein